ncbi:MAG: hypothetical protein RL701_2284, partial [Pseudomonadota bacterium]
VRQTLLPVVLEPELFERGVQEAAIEPGIDIERVAHQTKTLDPPPRALILC